MPVWTPGHYLVEDFARLVTDVRAYDAQSGAELAVTKVEKSLWSVSCMGSARVRVGYSVYAFTYTVGTSYIDNIHAIVNGASVYLYSERMKNAPARLTVVPRAEWKVVSTGLKRVSDWEFEAPDYDTLVDSPLEIGNQEVRKFVSGPATYEVSMFGSAPTDVERFVGDIKRVVEQTTPVFGHVPYERYVFLVNFTDTVGGGLEHLNSTVCFVPRLRMLPKEEYDNLMSLFSHEFFHAWNVKRLRPAGLGPFDYTSEVYTRSLWIAEGVTSYYDDLILRRAGVYSVEEYLDALALNLNLMSSFQGSTFQSAEEASFDAWIKYYKPNENSANVTASYYTQGATIGWMLDMAVRESTKGGMSLDDVMRRIYGDVYLKQNRGYTDREFEEACVAIGGPGAGKIFDARVRGREKVDFGRYLGYAGLSLRRRDERAGEKGYLGVKLKTEGGRTMVASVLAESPAEAMGVSANDEIIAVHGYRMGSDKVSFSIETTKPGDAIDLTLARNGRMMDLGGQVGSRPAFEYRIQPRADASSDEKALFKGWLLAEWRPELKYPEYSKSPDRKPAFDYV